MKLTEIGGIESDLILDKCEGKWHFLAFICLYFSILSLNYLINNTTLLFHAPNANIHARNGKRLFSAVFEV